VDSRVFGSGSGCSGRLEVEGHQSVLRIVISDTDTDIHTGTDATPYSSLETRRSPGSTLDSVDRG
jgi:hypothetical protein